MKGKVGRFFRNGLNKILGGLRRPDQRTQNKPINFPDRRNPKQSLMANMNHRASRIGVYTRNPFTKLSIDQIRERWTREELIKDRITAQTMKVWNYKPKDVKKYVLHSILSQ